jgi:hypothetical protein
LLTRNTGREEPVDAPDLSVGECVDLDQSRLAWDGHHCLTLADVSDTPSMREDAMVRSCVAEVIGQHYC